MAEPNRLVAALSYQEELDAARRPATMNPNIAAQGDRLRNRFAAALPSQSGDWSGEALPMEGDRLAAALRYQQELEEAQRPATMNPNMAAQGQRMNLPARQVPGPVSAFGTQAMSLNPQPNQGYGTMAAEMALGFVPGVGQAMAARDIERARRDNDPIGMGMAATSFVPFGKLIGALRGGKQMGPVSELDVYHGSPHRFPPTAKNPLGEFDASKIGTGEGAQAYGHGLYLAENPGVAKEYMQFEGLPSLQTKVELSKKTRDFLNDYVNPDTSSSQWLKAAKEDAKKFNRVEEFQELSKLKAKDIGSTPVGGNLYKVDLPDEQIAKMLDWDKPLSEQSAEVQKAIAAMPVSNSGQALLNKNPTGEQIYEMVSNYGYDKMKGSKHLNSLGIPGIRYLDQGSRVGGKGTSNFVVFPGGEGQLNILGRE